MPIEDRQLRSLDLRKRPWRSGANGGGRSKILWDLLAPLRPKSVRQAGKTAWHADCMATRPHNPLLRPTGLT